MNTNTVRSVFSIYAFCLAIVGIMLASFRVFATDPEYTYREASRAGTFTSVWGVAVSAPGNFNITSNSAITGTLTANAINATGTVTTAGGLTVPATCGAVTLNTNVQFGTTALRFTGAAAATPTNVVAGDGVGLAVRINGTNYFIRATLN